MYGSNSFEGWNLLLRSGRRDFMENYIKYGILLMLSMFIFCGCQKEENDPISVGLTYHITKDLDDNVQIDADIVFPEDIQREVDVLEIEYAKLDAQKNFDRIISHCCFI